MGYNWKPLSVQPIQVTTPLNLVHLCPVRGMAKLVVKERNLDDPGRWTVILKLEGTLEEMNKQFHVELYKLNITLEEGDLL
jgi:hypothetical protein